MWKSETFLLMLSVFIHSVCYGVIYLKQFFNTFSYLLFEMIFKILLQRGVLLFINQLVHHMSTQRGKLYVKRYYKLGSIQRKSRAIQHYYKFRFFQLKNWPFQIKILLMQDKFTHLKTTWNILGVYSYNQRKF